MIFNLPNPIPYAVKDNAELQNLWSKYNIIPRYGTNESGSFAFEDLVSSLCQLSPTFGSVTGDLAWYTFGLNASIATGIRPGLATEIEILPIQQQMVFEDFLASINIRLMQVMKVLRRIDYFLLASGNAYLHFKRIEVAGLVRYEITAPHFKHCAYVRSQDIGEDFIIISKFLTDSQLLQKYPPTILRATQMDEPLRWMKTGKGIEEAIVHLISDGGQTNISEGEYSGRPEILSVMPWLYVDFQSGNLSSKILATEVITKKIIAFMAQDPNTMPDTDIAGEQEINGEGYIGRGEKDHFKENMRVLKMLTTQLGRHPGEAGTGDAAASIAGIEIPFGSEAPTTIDLEMNRDTKDIEWRTDKATVRICSALRWSPELISDRPAKATLGGNLLYDIFMIKDTVTIQPRQKFYEDCINIRLQEIVEREGQTPNFPNYGIKLPEVIETLVGKLRTGASNTIVTPGTPSAGDPTINQAADNDENVNDSELSD